MRHGESEANAFGRIQGRRDYPLNEAGRAQARAASAWFSDKGVASVLCSPLERACDTARIVASGLGLAPPSVEPALIELDTGPFSGMSMAEIRERLPEDYARFQSSSWEGVRGAESAESMRIRALQAWERLKAEALRSAGNVLAVSHGGTLQWLVRIWFGARSWIPVLPTGNCCVYRLAVMPGEDGRAAYMQWRDLNTDTCAGLPRTPPVF